MRWLVPAIVSGAACLGCSRSPLLEGLEGGGGLGPSGSASSGAGSGAGGALPAPPSPCLLEPAGEPRSVVAFAEGGADTPSLVALERGGAGQPARVALQAISADANFWHPELRLATLAIGPSWPEDVTLEKPGTTIGLDAHAWGHLAPAAGESRGVALAWYDGNEGQPGAALKFRTFDTEAWSTGPGVVVDPLGTVVHRLTPGGALAGGGFAGAGYALSWRGHLESGLAKPWIAVLDESGAVILGPHASAAGREYPGLASGVTWTGAGYLVATGFDDCLPDDPACAPQSMVVTRIPPGGGGLEAVSSVSATPGWRPSGRPELSSWGESSWLGWFERKKLGPDEADDGLRVVRLAQLDESGAIVAVQTLTEAARPSLGLTLDASSVGQVAMWGETSDDDGPPHQPGAAEIVIHHRHVDGAPLGAPLRLPATALGYYLPARAVAMLDSPRGVLLSWAALGTSPGAPNEIYLARLDCR